MPPVLGPTRLHLQADLTQPIAGVWFPYTSTLAVALIRLASGKPIPPELRHSLLVQRAGQLLERASADAGHRSTLGALPARL